MLDVCILSKILVRVMGYLTGHLDYYVQDKPGHLCRENEIALEC